MEAESSTKILDVSADECYAFPVTSAQLRLWFLEQLEPNQTSYLIPWALRIHGRLDAEALAWAINQLVSRHEILRTTFKSSGGDPVQIVSPTLDIPLAVVDLGHLGQSEREVEAGRLVQDESCLPINLESGPLLRVRLVRLGMEDHLLLLTTHHIVFDGWSRGILLRELGAFYDGYLAGEQVQLPELPIQYADFAIWQKEHLSGETLDRHISYWKKQLQDAPECLALPTDRPRPAVQTDNGALSFFSLPQSLTEHMKSFSQKHGSTLFMTMLAGFQALLARYTGQDDIVVGTPIANRTRSELEGLIGLFANTLTLRTRLAGDPTFPEILARVRETALSAYAHQDMPFERLVQELRPERSLSHSPIFQVLFSLRNTPSSELKLGGMKLEFSGGGTETSKYDLSLYLEEDAGQIRGKVEYNTDLFDQATIDRMLRHYHVLLGSALKDPSKRLSQFDLLDSDESETLLVGWNQTTRKYSRGLCLHEVFEQQVVRRGDAPALEFRDQRLSYGELNGRANQLAHQLKKRGIAPGQRVGLFLERSLGMMVGMLGVLKSGAAYVPLDPAYPAERVRATLDAAGTSLLVTEEHLLSSLPEYAGGIICLERDRSLLDQESTANLASGARPEDVAYVIFTSGSTGRPKGVEVGHRGVVNLLSWMQEELEIGDNDVFPALASFAFDMSVPELYLALVSGGMVALGERHLPADGEELASFLRRNKASIVHATPTTWSLLLEAGFTGAGLKRCIGAEPLPYALFTRLMDAAEGTPLYNFYGPTETTVWSTFYRFQSRAESIVIGRPLANTELYILDSTGRPVPIGISGEIYIGGDGVALGYLNQPELTAEKFLPNPFSPDTGARLYRTGDLGRYLPDGRIEFAGRVDHQVKIRGYRIELEEIETVLGTHPSLRECVVMAREDIEGDKRLVAYVVPEPGLNAEASVLREWVKERLPEYMVPSAFVSLERLPLSPNGKVDRKSLAALDYGPLTKIGEMGNQLEEIIASIWADVLKSGEVTQTSNFFDLGGHSLLATKVVARIRQTFNVELPLRALFEDPTVLGLASRLETLLSEDRGRLAPPLVQIEDGRALPLSFAQQRLWFLDQLEPNSPFYNVPWGIRLEGALDLPALEAVLNEIVRRQDSLRTIFQVYDAEPVQVILPNLPLPLTIKDISHLPKELREEEATRLVHIEAQTPFSLSVGPLFRAFLLKVGEQDHVLILTLHHAISDGWSLGVLSGELAALYEAFHSGSPSPLPPLTLQYGDFAVWQRSYLEAGALEEQLSYWERHMHGAPPSIELPTDRLRPPQQTFRGAKETLFLPRELLEKLKTLSRSEGATLFITLLSAFNVLLSRYSGQQDIVVGTAIAGRHHPETEKLIGFFANTVVIRTDLTAEPTFRELVARVRETTLNAYANQDVPFEKLVEELNPVRDASRSPLFQVMIIQQNAFQSSHAFGSLKASRFSSGAATAKVDLRLNVSEQAGELRCALEYNTDLYDASSVLRMLEHYKALLELVVEDPTQRVSEITLQRTDETQRLLHDWNDTAQDYPREKCLHELIEEQAARTPDATAVAFGEEHLTYRELNASANRLAHYLRAKGIQRNDRVAIYLERSLNLMVALLGIQKSGAAYVPLDPAYPSERLRLIVEDAKISCLITQESLLTQPENYSGPVLCLDREAKVIGALSGVNLPSCAISEDAVYVIFTSGSTGRPKGVEVPHRSVVNLLTWMGRELDMGPGDVFPALASFAFDMSIPELYLALTTGGTVLLVPRERASNGEGLAQLLVRQYATVVHATPTTWSLLLEAGFNGKGLKRCVGAQYLPQELFRRLMDTAEGTPLYNFYGPTETTVWSTFYRFTSADERIVIGYPLANTQIYLLDQNRLLVPLGVTGSIYIGGDGVTKGYFDRPELTAEKFIANPFSKGSRLYSTGDLGRYLADGRIEFLGRSDDQVKIRGFRIELGEIESVLARHPEVRECAVIVREDQPGNKFIAAYVAAVDPATHLDIAELRDFAKKHLPDYMVPRGWMQMEKLPLTANGKVDRRHLPVDLHSVSTTSGQIPTTAVEVRLAAIWEEVLNVSSVRLDDDFFSLGGHSLLAVQMMSRAREAFGCELPLTLLFGHPRLGDLARIIDTERGKYPLKTIIPIRKTGSKPPLFCISRPNVNALGFVFLTRHLPADQPVIGVQSAMEKDGSNWVYDQADYESKAAEYVHEIRAVEPNGPYLLIGYCEGAHIAFEMARQLDAMNLPVAMLGILDVWPIENTVDRRKFVLAGYWRALQRFYNLTLTGKFRYLAGLPRNEEHAGASEAESPTVEQELRQTVTAQLKKRYWPGPDFEPTHYSGELTLFRVQKQLFVRIKDYTMGWSNRALGGVNVISVAGTHKLLLREPFVADLAAKMQTAIDRGLRNCAKASDGNTPNSGSQNPNSR